MEGDRKRQHYLGRESPALLAWMEEVREARARSARYALHKLWISSRRPVAEQTKAAKDLRQAEALLDLLLEDRPGDLLAAWDVLRRAPSQAETVLTAMDHLAPVVRERLASRLPIEIA